MFAPGRTSAAGGDAIEAAASAAAQAPAALPAPGRLAALGTVLCLYPARGAELHGFRRAVGTEAHSELHSDGCYESLRFRDAAGRCCWRLFLLPDSDFVAWEALARRLPLSAPASGGVAERLWRRLSEGLSASAWRASVLRFDMVADGGGTPRLGACLAVPSPLGAEVARRIARAEGVEGDPVPAGIPSATPGHAGPAYPPARPARASPPRPR